MNATLESAPTSFPSEYGSIDRLPKEVQDYCEKIHDELTISQLRDLGDYFHAKANKLREVAENNVTIEDFENKKKEDVDDDNEEGEAGTY